MDDLDLKKLVEDLHGYMGITRKRPIADVVNAFPGFTGGLSEVAGVEVLADFGEDAAVLSGPGDDDNVLLLAADGIMSVMMDADPYWSGYCSVLVNLHDIAAMGGLPMAIVDVISIKEKDSAVLSSLTSGMNDACTKVGVPIVGGHIHPDSEFNAVDVAILGTAPRAGVIYSHTAELDDHIIFAMDLDGRVHPKTQFAWDSTLHKGSDVVQRQLRIMPELGSQNLLTAGKDISNPGALGTLGMLLESSCKGAYVDLTKIPRPNADKIEFNHWLKVYQGCGFVVSCDPLHTDEVIKKFKSVGLSAGIAGEITEDRKFFIGLGSKEELLFDFYKDKITGIE